MRTFDVVVETLIFFKRFAQYFSTFVYTEIVYLCIFFNFGSICHPRRVERC